MYYLIFYYYKIPIFDKENYFRKVYYFRLLL